MKRFTRSTWTHKITVLVAILALLAVPLVALADSISGDADALVLQTPHANSLSATQNGGTTVAYDFSAAINDTGSASNNVFPGTVLVTITRSGDWLDSSGGVPVSFTFTQYNVGQVGALQITVPCGAEGTSRTMTVDLSAGTSSNGKPLNPDSVTLTYVITAGPDDASCTPANTAPTANAGGPYSVGEGGSVTLSGSGSDPDAGQTQTYAWDLDNNGTFETAGQNPTFSAAGRDGLDSQTVVLRVCDNGTPSLCDTDSTTVTINNVVPTANVGPDKSSSEGSPIAFTFSCTDPGTADTWTASVDWGDGSAVESLGGVTCNSGTFGASHTYADDDGSPFSVTLTVNDDDGGSDDDTANANITNADPVANAGADQSGTEGSPVTFTFSCTDAGTVDTWTASVDWGDGSAVESLSAEICNSGTFGASHTYADNSNYTVTLTVTDDDLGSGSDTASANVANVAPTITSVVAGAVASCGGSNSITVYFTDPGTADTWSASIDWGDGNTTNLASVTTGFGASHAYAHAGVYTVTVVVTDDDGGVSAPKTAQVTLKFNLSGILQPINPGPPNSVFKYGSTIPVKVKVQDCDGSYPGNLILKVTWQLLSSGTPTGDVSEPYSTSAADTGNTMRFTGAPDNQYIFNLASKSFPDGTATYRIYVTIQSTNQVVSADIGLKPK